MHLLYRDSAVPAGLWRVVAIFCLAAFPLITGGKAQPSVHSSQAANAEFVNLNTRPGKDLRTERLARYFKRLHCPVLPLAADFVHAADANHLDWRLLPSISVVESGGGKAYRNNNIFGWNNGSHSFVSIRSGIHEVAYHLGRGRLYRDRDSAGKLRIYNTSVAYSRAVLSVMNQISPLVPPQRSTQPS